MKKFLLTLFASVSAMAMIGPFPGTGSGGSSGGSSGITSINGNTNAAQTIAAGSGIGVSSASGTTTISATNSGTVTSVGLADSTNLFNVTGTPVTGSGTLTLSSFKNENANTFLANNTSSSAAPTFQALSSLAGNGISFGGSSLGVFPDGKTVQLNASGQLIAVIPPSTATGNVTGPGSNTVGDVATYSATANTLVDNGFSNINNTSGARTETFGAASLTNLISLNTSNATGWSTGISVTGTWGTTNPTLNFISILPTTNASSNAANIFNVNPNVSASVSGVWVNYFGNMHANNSGTGFGINAKGAGGNIGGEFTASSNNGGAATSSQGLQGYANSNLAAGGRFLSQATLGSSSHAYGVIGQATQDSVPAQAVGGYFSIGSSDTSAFENITTAPGFNSALAADNTDTGATIIAGLNNGTSLFAVEKTYVQIGQNGTTTSTVNINNKSVAAGSGTATYTNTAPGTASLTLKYLQVIINGSTAYIPYLQ